MAVTAPLNQDLQLGIAGKPAGPCVFVLFGAGGDLTKRWRTLGYEPLYQPQFDATLAPSTIHALPLSSHIVSLLAGREWE
ncbi:MAG: hypothetical protein L0Z53_25060 [Acidobacteriales bacterium]|nr:hypothetical protein [Terriglobales bacterium]